MARNTKSKKAIHNPTIKPSNLEQKIRCRAYELYEERGKVDGHALEDWLRAEAAINQTVRA